jgi:putative PIN family toxin of toxin-antitoxin system
VKVVLDAGVVFSAAGWRGEAHQCLIAMAKRRLKAFATETTIQELIDLVGEKRDHGSHSPEQIVTWYLDNVKRVQPAPLGKQRSRDPKDDPYLACALGAGAKIIVSRDQDLLTLGKPFGIEIITPRQLLARLAGGV